MVKTFVGKIVNTHGIKGEFRIKSDFSRKDLVFAINKEIIIENKTYKIKSYRVHKDYDMIILEGFDDINLVLPLKGQNVYVLRDNLGLKSGEFIVEDLVGMAVYNGKILLGEVTHYYPSLNPLIEVMGEKKFFIPLNGAYIESVNLAQNKILVSANTEELIL